MWSLFLSFSFNAAVCDPAKILSTLAKKDAVRCEIVQAKRSKLFKRAMESKARVAAKGSGSFRFETLPPQVSVLVVANGKAIFQSTRADGTISKETIAIDKLPKASAFLSAFSGLFTGHAAPLLDRFSAEASCSGGTSSVKLIPKDAAFSDILALTLTVEREALTKIVIDEKNEDSSELRLSGCTSDGVTDALFSE
jgi:Outer membrane lipoprotein carrier protein LolA-like